MASSPVGEQAERQAGPDLQHQLARWTCRRAGPRTPRATGCRRRRGARGAVDAHLLRAEAAAEVELVPGQGTDLQGVHVDVHRATALRGRQRHAGPDHLGHELGRAATGWASAAAAAAALVRRPSARARRAGGTLRGGRRALRLAGDVEGVDGHGGRADRDQQGEDGERDGAPRRRRSGPAGRPALAGAGLAGGFAGGGLHGPAAAAGPWSPPAAWPQPAAATVGVDAGGRLGAVAAGAGAAGAAGVAAAGAGAAGAAGGWVGGTEPVDDAALAGRDSCGGSGAFAVIVVSSAGPGLGHCGSTVTPDRQPRSTRRPSA